MPKRVFAVLPAAGNGTRMFGGAPEHSKVLLRLLSGFSSLELSLKNLLRADVFCGVAIATRISDLDQVKSVLAEAAPGLESIIVPGGDTRQDSVFAALKAAKGHADYVAVHDAARPFCKPELVRAVVDTAMETQAAILALPESCTLKHSEDQKTIHRTTPRTGIWQAQTPQVFDFNLLFEAYEKAEREGYQATDDSELVERKGHPVTLVRGDPLNIKLTTPEDLEIAGLILAQFLNSAPSLFQA